MLFAPPPFPRDRFPELDRHLDLYFQIQPIHRFLIPARGLEMGHADVRGVLYPPYPLLGPGMAYNPFRFRPFSLPADWVPCGWRDERRAVFCAPEGLYLVTPDDEPCPWMGARPPTGFRLLGHFVRSRPPWRNVWLWSLGQPEAQPERLVLWVHETEEDGRATLMFEGRLCLPYAFETTAEDVHWYPVGSGGVVIVAHAHPSHPATLVLYVPEPPGSTHARAYLFTGPTALFRRPADHWHPYQPLVGWNTEKEVVLFDALSGALVILPPPTWEDHTPPLVPFFLPWPGGSWGIFWWRWVSDAWHGVLDKYERADRVLRFAPVSLHDNPLPSPRERILPRPWLFPYREGLYLVFTEQQGFLLDVYRLRHLPLAGAERRSLTPALDYRPPLPLNTVPSQGSLHWSRWA